jgi:hypothetical protein
MNAFAIGGYNRVPETSRTITRFCGYNIFVTAPENQFGEFMMRKYDSIKAVPEWATFARGE